MSPVVVQTLAAIYALEAMRRGLEAVSVAGVDGTLRENSLAMLGGFVRGTLKEGARQERRSWRGKLLALVVPFD